MKQLFGYVRRYLNEFFDLKLYAVVAVFLAICIYFNYEYNFENGIVDSYRGSELRWLFFFFVMGFPYLFVCVLLYAFDINRTWLKSKEFWLLFVFGFTIISFQRSFYYHDAWFHELARYDMYFVTKLFYKLKPILLTVLPLMIFYAYYERQRDTYKSWYGLNFKRFDFRPYAILILVVFVGIGLASFLGDLTKYYPRFTKSGGAMFAMQHGLDSWVTMLIYELVYGSTFIGVELFFRGFLVIGFARVLGGHAVLAMVGSYVFLHFGKPMSECISSAFGGYLIGILAYYSRHIWGGVVLHVALAWFMELFAWLQKTYNHH
ncbi:MAG: hypothetical protein OCD76_20685 [Reichenbachiella sp.]